MKSQSQLEEEKKAIAEKAYNSLTALYRAEIVKVFAWFAAHYPKRTLMWCSGMGAAFWVLDDEILHWNTLDTKYTSGMWETYYVDAVPDKRAKKLIPLWDFFQSIHDVTHTFGQLPCLGDINQEDFTLEDFKRSIFQSIASDAPP